MTPKPTAGGIDNAGAAHRSLCPFCSMGCTLLIRPPAHAPYVGEAATLVLDYDLAAGGHPNRGSLCGKGNMALELLTSPARLDAPRVRGEGGLRPTTWEGALDATVHALQTVRTAHGGEAIGIVAGPYLTNEETALAAELARALGTPHLDLGQPEDRVVLAGLARAGATPAHVTDVAEIDAMTAILVVGDLFTLAPCMAKPVLNARYDRRRNTLGTLGFWKSRTMLFGKPVLRCLPGRESAALALLLKMALRDRAGGGPGWATSARSVLTQVGVEDLEELAGLSAEALRPVLEALRTEARTGVLLGCGFAEAERLDLVAGLAALVADLTGSRFLAMANGANSLGVRTALVAAGYPGPDGLTAPEMLEAAGTGDLKALLAFGADPLGAAPGRVPDEAATRLEFLAATAPLPGQTLDAAHVVFPAAAWGEKQGTVTNSFGRQVRVEPVMTPPGTARPDEAILRELLARMPAADVGPARLHRTTPARTRPGGFFQELELHLRLERRGLRSREVGSHVLFPEFSPAHGADGWLTRHLSWAQHEMPAPRVAVSPAHAAALGVREGERVRLRSRDTEAVLEVRIEKNLQDDVVLVPPHYPEVRRLTDWRLDPALRDLDLRPGRVSVERIEEARA